MKEWYSIRNTPTEKFEELPKQYLISREAFVYDVKSFTTEEFTNDNDVSSVNSSMGKGLFD